MKKLIFCFAFIAAGVLFASETYYVKSGGTGNLTQGNTLAQAWSYDTLALARKGGTVIAGDTIYIVGGATYVLSTPVGDTCLNPGTATAVISYIGIKSATTNEPPLYSDWIPQADTTNMPRINFTTKRFSFSNFSYIYGLYIYGDTARGVIPGDYNNFLNCAFVSSASSSTTNYLIYANTYDNFVGCYFKSINGKGVYGGSYDYFDGCVFDHFSDATNGVGVLPSTSTSLVDCIWIKNTVGANVGAKNGVRFKRYTFDSCGLDVSATTGYSCVFIDGLNRYSSTNCYKWTTKTPANLFIRNHIGLNTKAVACNLVDTTGVFQDHWQTSGDPKVTTPGVKYTLESDSPCIDSGYNVKFGLQ